MRALFRGESWGLKEERGPGSFLEGEETLRRAGRPEQLPEVLDALTTLHPPATRILGRDTVDYHLGGGLVWDSNAEAEWRETEAKSREFGAAMGALGAGEVAP